MITTIMNDFLFSFFFAYPMHTCSLLLPANLMSCNKICLSYFSKIKKNDFYPWFYVNQDSDVDKVSDILTSKILISLHETEKYVQWGEFQDYALNCYDAFLFIS